MDDTLYCNWLKCRKPLHIHGQAVVTTCSHIFCVSCANELFGANKSCPACEATLDRPDDVVISSLNPSTDYRTSVLAGLAPSITMEIATRSISFWTYQKSQEATFQAMVLKNAQERNAVLEKRMQSMSMESANEMALLHEKIAGLEKELGTEKRKTKDLQDSLRAATKDYDRLKNQLDRTMRKQLLSASGTGDVLSAAAQRPDSGVQRQVINESLANQQRATIGGTQKPASFWHSQASTQSQSQHTFQNPPVRGMGDNAMAGGAAAGVSGTPTHGSTPNHGRFMVNGAIGRGIFNNAAGASGGDATMSMGHAGVALGRAHVEHRSHPAPSGGGTALRAAGMMPSPRVPNGGLAGGQARLGGTEGSAVGFASPVVSSNWAQPRPISQNLVRPVPKGGTRLSSSAEGFGHDHRAPNGPSRGSGGGAGFLGATQTPRGASPVGSFLRTAMNRQAGADGGSGSRFNMAR